jgi:hypothetical protein
MHLCRLSTDVAPDGRVAPACQAAADMKPGRAHTKAPVTRDPAT